MSVRMEVKVGVRLKMVGEFAKWGVSLGEYDMMNVLRTMGDVAKKQLKARAKRITFAVD